MIKKVVYSIAMMERRKDVELKLILGFQWQNEKFLTQKTGIEEELMEA